MATRYEEYVTNLRREYPDVEPLPEVKFPELLKTATGMVIFEDEE